MIPLQNGELSSMQDTQVDSMIDECVIEVYSNAADNPLGEPTVVYTDGATTPCSFTPNSQREVSEGTDVVVADATVRLPLTMTIKARDRIRMTKIARQAITPVRYEVIGSAARRKTTVLLELKFIGAV